MSGDKPPLVNPDEIPFPTMAPDYLEMVAKDVKDDGGNIADSGNTIRSTWQGLGEVYSAPESSELLAAVDQVAELGEGINDALKTVADALVTFAEEGGAAKKKLVELRSEARDFLESIEADGEDWNKDEDKVAEHEDLRGRINDAILAYQQAERRCANTITSLIEGGTTFVAGDPAGDNKTADNEQVYGLEEIPEQASMPWGGPQMVDAPWYVDAAAGTHDLWVGGVRDMGSMAGFHRDGDWGVESTDEWLANEKAYWYETYQGSAALTGFYTPTEGWGVDSAGEWANNVTQVRLQMAHSMVPWTEWDERPGYVLTQGGGNIGTAIGGALLGATGVGAPAGAALLSRAGLQGLRGLRGAHPDTGDLSARPDADGGDRGEASGSRPDALPDRQASPDGSGDPTTAYVQHIMDQLDLDARKVGITAAMDKHKALQHELAMAGGPSDGHMPDTGSGIGDSPQGAQPDPPTPTRDTGPGSPSSGDNGHGLARDGNGSSPMDGGSGNGMGNRGPGSVDLSPHTGGGDGSQNGGSGGSSHQEGTGSGENQDRGSGHSSPEETVRWQVEKANSDPEWFEKYYKSNGHRRNTTFLDENGDTLPQLTRASDSDPWIAKDTLSPPKKPDYIGEAEHGKREHASPEQREELDRFAQERREAIDKVKNVSGKSEDDSPEGSADKDEHSTETEDGENYASAQRNATKKAEAFGERVAEQAVLERYPNAKKVEIPDTAPRNGNDQFDQIWEVEKGKYIVVEAKSDISTPLGERTIKDEEGQPKRVSQGKKEYFDKIIEEMEKRGNKDGNKYTEEDIAYNIKRAKNNGDLDYVEIKGKAKDNKYNGYSYSKFDI